jgi:methionyl-tRNA synthetase
MSKSSGNIPDPMEYERKYGTDVLRYFEMREIVYGLDVDFSNERLIERYNSDLANNLGNLASRVLRMAQSYCAGEVRATPTSIGTLIGLDSETRRLISLWPEGPLSIPTGAPEEILAKAICAKFTDLPDRIDQLVKELEFNRALEILLLGLDAANKYIVITEPFKMAKDPAAMPRVEQILANLLEALRVAADLLEPFMPTMAAKLVDLLNADEKTLRAPYGEGLKPGHRVKPPIPLFPRIDKPVKVD